MGGPSIERGESSGDIWTPWEFMRAVECKFGPVAVDLAASGPQSAKAARWITPEEDSLKQDWTTMLNGGLGWDNCPYGNIAPWAKYHAEHWKRGARTLLLVPASVGANWYWDYVEPCATVYSVGRIAFENCLSRKTGELVTTVYPKDLILCHYGEYPSSGLRRWLWRREVEVDVVTHEASERSER
jgi:phage N-6-adenine-methyltransferase